MRGRGRGRGRGESERVIGCMCMCATNKNDFIYTCSGMECWCRCRRKRFKINRKRNNVRQKQIIKIRTSVLLAHQKKTHKARPNRMRRPWLKFQRRGLGVCCVCSVLTHCLPIHAPIANFQKPMKRISFISSFLFECQFVAFIYLFLYITR